MSETTKQGKPRKPNLPHAIDEGGASESACTRVLRSGGHTHTVRDPTAHSEAMSVEGQGGERACTCMTRRYTHHTHSATLVWWAIPSHKIPRHERAPQQRQWSSELHTDPFVLSGLPPPPPNKACARVRVSAGELESNYQCQTNSVIQCPISVLGSAIRRVRGTTLRRLRQRW